MAKENNEYMSYDEYLSKIREGIVTQNGNCPVTPLLLMLQGRWKSQLMYEMCIYDTVRFGQLKKDLSGITNTMLTKSLRELEEDGLVSRKQFNEIPPHVEYSLTQMGRDLLPVFYSIMNWGFKYEKQLYGEGVFCAYEDMQKDFLAAPKYGNDDPYVDKIVADLYKMLADFVVTKPTITGGTTVPCGISITSHQPGGLLTGATPDGRKAGYSAYFVQLNQEMQVEVINCNMQHL